MSMHTNETNTFSVYKKYGVGIASGRRIASSLWKIPLEIQDIFTRYYLLYWDAEYLRSKIKDGQVEHDGVQYVIRYYSCDSSDLYHCEGQVALSFRVLQNEYDHYPVVLIRAPLRTTN